MILTEAEHHFYPTYDDLRTRILTSLSLGCDFYEGGFKNAGPFVLQSNVNALNNNSMEDLNKSLKDHIAKN